MSVTRKVGIIEPAPKPDAKRRVAVVLGLLLLACAFAALVVFAVRRSGSAAGGKHGGHDRDDNGPVPVTLDPAVRGDFVVYVDALGTVTALNTVTVRSRVDGEVTAVNYAEGQAVKKGDLLIEIDPRQYQANLQQAQGQLARDQAMLQNAKADVDRYTAARETVSQQQIDTAQAGVAEYQGAIKVDQAAVASANLQLSYCKITSPLAGKIGLRAVDAGNIVRAADATGLATITQLDPIAVIFNLPESNLPEVLAAGGKGHKLTAEIYDATRTRRYAAGELEAVDNQIDATTATVRIKAIFPNGQGVLYPNQFVNVRLKIKTLKGVTLAPTPAVQQSPDGPYVYVAKADNTADLRRIKVGDGDALHTVIESGLSPGDRVITQNLDKLSPGHPITTQPYTDAMPGTRPATQPAGPS